MDSFVFIIVTNLHFITSAGTTTTSFLEFTSLGANEWPEKNGVIDLKKIIQCEYENRLKN